MSPHPLEHLRYLARSWEPGEEPPMGEVASVLGELATESPTVLLQACRRLIEYFPASGPVWWMSARVLSAADPAEAVWQAADELSDDPTWRLLADALPPSGAVAMPEVPRQAALAMRRRRDVAVERKPGRAGLLVVSPLAAGPGDVLLSGRVAGAVSQAVKHGKPVWAVVPRGVVLPAALWEQVLLRTGLSGDPSASPASLALAVLAGGVFDRAVSEGGTGAVDDALSKSTCPAAAELLGWKS